MVTELTSSREDIIPTEPVSSHQLMQVKHVLVLMVRQKGKSVCTENYTYRNHNLLESIKNNKVYLRITGKHCDVEVTKKAVLSLLRG